MNKLLKFYETIFNTKSSKSLKKRLIKILILVSIIPLILASIFNYLKANSILKDNFNNQLQSSSIMVKGTIDDYIGNLKEDLNSLEINANIKTLKTDGRGGKSEKLLISEFDNYKNTHPDILNAYLSTPNKECYISGYPEVDLSTDDSQKDWFKNAVNSKDIIISDTYIDKETKKPTITLSKAVYGDNKELVGVIALDINLDSLNKKISSQSFGKTGSYLIVDKSGTVIINKNNELVNKKIEGELKDKIAQNKDTASINYKDTKNIKSIANISTNKETGWMVIASIEESEILNQTYAIIKNNLIIGILLFIVTVFIGILSSHSILKPIKELGNVVEKMGKGDFTVKTNIESKDEIGMLSNTFNNVIDDLSHLLRNVQNISQNVNVSADNLASISEETTSSTEEVARTIGEIANATSDQAEQTQIGVEKTNDLSERIETVSNALEEVSEQFKSTDELSDKGIEKVNILKDSADLTSKSSQKVEKVILEVDKRSQEISSIIQTIQSIAEQTNLLSLNASIESARAGEYGRGFSVVAQEIRKLAEQSADATNKIRDIINGIQTQSKVAVNTMQENKNTIENQYQAVKETENIFNEIRNSIKVTSDTITEVSELNKDMLSKKDEITSVMENISASSEQTSASTQEISASTEEQLATFEEISRTAEQLNLLTEKLNEEIKKFTV